MLWVCKALLKDREVPPQLRVFPPRLPKRREVRLPCCQRAELAAWALDAAPEPAGGRDKGTKRSATSGCGIDHRQEKSICQTTPDKAKTKSVKIPWDFSIVVAHSVCPRAPDMVVIKREVGECFSADFSVLFHETLPLQI